MFGFYFFWVLGLGFFLGFALMPRISTPEQLTHALVNYKLWVSHWTLIRVQWLEPFLLYNWQSYILLVPLTADHHQEVSSFWGQLTIACIHPGNHQQLLGPHQTDNLSPWYMGPTASFGGVGSMPEYTLGLHFAMHDQ